MNTNENEDERGLYQKGRHFHVETKVSRDGTAWIDAESRDLSAGGLNLRTDEVFKIGETVWLDLTVQGFFSMFEIKIKGNINGEKHYHGHRRYDVSFVGLSQDLQIMIDENTKHDRPIGRDPYTMD